MIVLTPQETILQSMSRKLQDTLFILYRLMYSIHLHENIRNNKGNRILLVLITRYVIFMVQVMEEGEGLVSGVVREQNRKAKRISSRLRRIN